ncbi:hypothetical protein BU26DRAFT_559614 [Trematosphaeria pertusa]|uniref:Uncharacterized protein n=1 Tax=Trematosphaeria pertusa TaxID=390896 RepID=A0A6A6IYH5_9PLEO|nr:uncharacterized protein BU26DRAFT_559614 [Trematosphaeria pertusa]KAF2254972.1 hypothetical protein BU26DRAFT_559614 [Trematosphaeria pertusa]
MANSSSPGSPTNDSSSPHLPDTKSPRASTASQKPTPKWYHKLFKKGQRPETEQPGKEKWRDANLPDEERWKDWKKAQDRAQKAGSTTGYLGQFYKAKGGRYW